MPMLNRQVAARGPFLRQALAMQTAGVPAVEAAAAAPGQQMFLCSPYSPPAAEAAATDTGRAAWSSNLYSREQLTGTGQMAGDMWSALASSLAVVGTAAGAYHGYKRTGSTGWAIGWALAGGLFPIITIPVALAQGFGKPSAGFPRARAAARGRR